jgi:tetratricopeptide (TPR) repeat protein
LVFNELGDLPAALDASLSKSHPKDSIVRKLYSLLAQCHRRAGSPKDALERCRAGRAIYPDDAELLFIESYLLKENNDLRGAEELMLRLIRGREEEHFGSVATGLRGHVARHNLACLYFDTGRFREAESQWRAALVEDPQFILAHLGLGELHLRQRNWPAMERTAQTCVPSVPPAKPAGAGDGNSFGCARTLPVLGRIFRPAKQCSSAWRSMRTRTSATIARLCGSRFLG